MEYGPLSIDDYRKILDNIYATVLVTDVHHRVLYVNQHSTKVLKAPAERLVGFTTDELIEQGYLTNASSTDALALRQVVIRKVGGIMDIPVLAVANPIFDEDGTMEGAVVFSVDEHFQEQIIQSFAQSRYNSDQLVDYFSQAQIAGTEIVAESPAMKRILGFIARVCNSDSTILFTGESGTGKDVLAQYVHQSSPRKHGVFVPVNCAAVPAELMESEFFGYHKGAFTGANRNGRAGFFELADGGTLFLDEIGDLPLSLQAKLLRALESGEVTRIGGENVVRINVRVLAATNRDLKVMCREGRFREDLYYRLNVISIDIPPLSQRREDILPLAKGFLKRLNKKYDAQKVLSHHMEENLQLYDWPGNVRELRNVIERLHISSTYDILGLEPDTLSIPAIQARHEEVTSQTGALWRWEEGITLREIVDEYERQVIRQAVEHCGGSVARAAAMLKVDKTSLYRRLKREK